LPIVYFFGSITSSRSEGSRGIPDLKKRAAEAGRKMSSSKARPRVPVNTDAPPTMRIGK